MIRVEQVGPVTVLRMARSFLGRPLHWCAAYWVDGLLIDAGPACAARELVRVLEPVAVEQVIITHCHEDHIGGLPALHRRFPHASIYAAPRSLPGIEQPAKLKMQLYRRLLWGTPQPFYKSRPLPDVIHTRDHTFRVIETPGHTRDHVAFFEAERRWLFSGDAYITGQERLWSADLNLFAIVGALRTLVALNPTVIFSGCGAVRKEPAAELLGKIRYLTQLSAHVRQLAQEGATRQEMVAQVLGGESPLRFWTGGHFSAAELIEACLNFSHLVERDPSARPRPESTASHAQWDASDTDIAPDLEDFGDLGDLGDYGR